MTKTRVSVSGIMDISAVFPGFRFSPTDTELISHYLKHKIDGSDSSGDVIAQVEICKFEPWDLPAKSIIKSDHEWFFFAPCDKRYPNGSQARRATEVGFWKATGKEREIKSGKKVIGAKRTLVFHIGRAPKGTRTNWIMHEYCLKQNKDDKCQESYVICRLRKNHDLPKNVSPGTASEVCDDLAQIQMEECGGDKDSMVKTIEDDCFTDILKDDIIKLDYCQCSGAPSLPNVAECSAVQVPIIAAVCSSNPWINHFQGAAQQRIRLEMDRLRRNRGKIPGISPKDSLKPDEGGGRGIGKCILTCMANSKNSLLMANGWWLSKIVFIMVVFTLFFLRGL